jgi:hypothetical protein
VGGSFNFMVLAILGVLVVGSFVGEHMPKQQVESKPYCTVGTEVHCAYKTLQDCEDSRTQYETCQENPEGK